MVLHRHSAPIYDYTVNTPITQQLSDAVSPQSIEASLTFAICVYTGKLSPAQSPQLIPYSVEATTTTVTEKMTFAQRLFLSEEYGITSPKLANSAVAGYSGTWNTRGSLFKIGWSNRKEYGGGMQLRIGLGKNQTNPNKAWFHMYVPKTFVPNSFSVPSMQLKKTLRNMDLGTYTERLKSPLNYKINFVKE